MEAEKNLIMTMREMLQQQQTAMETSYNINITA